MRYSHYTLLALVLLSVNAVEPVAAQERRVYLAVDDHTDYMWTGDEEAYRRAFVEMLDYYLDLADKTDTNPVEHQSRFNCDGWYWLWVYQENKSTAEFERLVARVKSGHISFPLNALVLCYGGVPAEAVLRGMYYPGKLQRKFQLQIPLAVAMENQTHPFGLTSLWAGSGAKYSWKGICNCATRVVDAGEREHPLHYRVGPDGSRILMKWYPCRDNQSLGGYAEARRPADAIRIAESEEWFTKRNRGQVIGLFGQGWDDLATKDDLIVKSAISLTTKDRKVIVSNEVDFFEDISLKPPAQFPEIGCSYGNEWDLLCASLAEVSASVKRSMEKLRSAEAMAAVISLHKPDFMRGWESQRDRAWADLGLYWEHDWTADGPVSRESRTQWQRKLAIRIADYVDKLFLESSQALGETIQYKTPDAVWVFNPLSWSRSDIATLAYDGPSDVRVFDAVTEIEVPSQIVDWPKRRLEFIAKVPACGYRIYEIRPGKSQEFSSVADAQFAADGNLEIETASHQLTFTARGSVDKLVDKETIINLAGTLEGRTINDLGPGDGRLKIVSSGPVSFTAIAESDKPLAHKSMIRIVRGHPRIELHNEIIQNFGDVQTWSYAFDIDKPVVHHEECGAVLKARLLDDGGHYAPTHARYDWLTLNHFADISSSQGTGVTVSNADCYFMRVGKSDVQHLDTETSSIQPLIGGQVDGEKLGILKQGGDSHFTQRFAIQTHQSYSAANAMRFSFEHQNSLICGRCQVAKTDATDAFSKMKNELSLLQVSNPNVLVWAFKVAEDGADQGFIVRLWNGSSQPAAGDLNWTLPIEKAFETTHIETDIREVPHVGKGMKFQLPSQGWKTFRVRLRVE
jgi:alpha-mannosidase